MVNSGMHFVHPVEIIAMQEEPDDEGSGIPFDVSFIQLFFFKKKEKGKNLIYYLLLKLAHH